MSPYRVVLADNRTMLRELVKKMLSQIIGLKVVGEATDRFQLLPLVDHVEPNLVILNIAIPNLGGIRTAQNIKTSHPEVGILIMTMEKKIDYVCQATSLGVEGYLLEEEGPVELLSAINLIRRGGTYVSPRLYPLVPDNLTKICYQALKPVYEVTSREKEILRLIAEGKSNSEIANLFYISVRTVEHHRANLMKKLNLRRITDLIKYAIRNGITTP